MAAISQVGGNACDPPDGWYRLPPTRQVGGNAWEPPGGWYRLLATRQVGGIACLRLKGGRRNDAVLWQRPIRYHLTPP